MEKLVFELNGEEYITLPKLLKSLSLIGSGGEIRFHLENEAIIYNGEVEYRKRKKCFSGDIIIFNDEVEITIK